MEKQHLTYFKIENFKRFDSFEMSNLGQFNLIVGDNNVGKTSVLEALLFNENLVNWRASIQSSIVHRGFFGDKIDLNYTDLKDVEIWSFIFKNTKIPITITVDNECKFQITLSLVLYTDLSVSEKETVKDKVANPVPKFWLREKIYNDYNPSESQLITAYFEDNIDVESSNYMPFIPANLSYADDLVGFFYNYINVNKELKREVEKSLRGIIPHLEEIRVHKFSKTHELLCVVLTNSNNIYPLVRYGDGTVKITRILLEILLARSNRLMVDEIGSGIHFTRLKEYWKTIILLCTKYDVQLFATTHSLECQQAFVEALDDPEMQQYQKDARNISLIENKSGEVKAVTYDFEQFEYALNIGFNTRGGKR